MQNTHSGAIPKTENEMKLNELKNKINEGALSSFSNIYSDTESQKSRYIASLDRFAELFGEDRDVYVLSVPGRSEILGNHTDHNRGMVLAGAIDRDIIAVVSPNEDGFVRLKSEGYELDEVDLSLIDEPENFKKYSSAALIAGVARGLFLEGYSIGGLDAYTTSDVLKGSGISSSAAYEVMIGNIFNHLYNDGKIDNVLVAKISQYAENVFFGKPCGLMDQMACAVGGFVFMDFCDPKSPIIEPIAFSLRDEGYELCIVNTGGNHADLNEDYASVPAEMKGVAELLSREVLRGVSEGDLIKSAPVIREKLGDRALLRALHFVRENSRVLSARTSLLNKNINGFFAEVLASGKSSFEYLQNVYTTKNVKEQGLSLALCLTEGFLSGKGCAQRVHGGGFAGTIQAYVKREDADEYVALMDSVFGKGAVMRLNIRPVGACRIF